MIRDSLLEFRDTGASGTGKEMVARAIMRRAIGHPFVTINCGAIPENLVESELFGHVKGLYKCLQRQNGSLEVANLGTVFLDEVDALPVSIG